MAIILEEKEMSNNIKKIKVKVDNHDISNTAGDRNTLIACNKLRFNKDIKLFKRSKRENTFYFSFPKRSRKMLSKILPNKSSKVKYGLFEDETKKYIVYKIDKIQENE